MRLFSSFKKLLGLGVLALAMLAVPSIHAAPIYVAQVAAGANTGLDCADAHAISFFNNSTNQTAASAAGGFVLCGTITTRLTALVNGSAVNNPIIVQWASGASLQVCNTTDAFDVSGRSNWLLDLGGNTTAIECPNNGTGLSTTIDAIGIGDGGNNASGIEVRNGTIGPLFIYVCVNGGNPSTSCPSTGVGSFNITIASGSNNYFHDLSLNNANEGIHQGYGNGISTSGNQIVYNTFASSVGRAIEYSNGYGQSTTDTGTIIANNDIALGTVWQSGSGDYTHIEAILTYNDGSSGTDTLTGMLIYNNYIHGAPSCCTSAFISVYNGLSCPSTNSSWQGNIFNNLLVDTAVSGTNPGFGDGMIYNQDCHHTIGIYNNILDAGAQGHTQGLACVEFEGTNTLHFENNLCLNSNSMITNQDGAPTLTSNYNDFYNVGSMGASGWSWHGTSYNTLAAWKTGRSQDANSISTVPGLNSDYTITNTSSAVYQTGINLTSLSLTNLDTGKPLSVGAGTESSTGTARSPSVAWDMGVYPFSSGSVPAPPTGLNAVAH